MANFLLIHGAFQGGWVWSETAAALRELGHGVHSPTLSGCGHLHHSMRRGLDLNTYIQDMANYILFEGLSQVTIVASSFAGMICGALAMRTPHLVRRAVYLDALIPESNRSFVETAGESFHHMLEAHRLKGGRIQPWPLQVFGVDADKADWFRPRLCDFPEAAFRTPFPGEFDPLSVDSVYIACQRTPSPFIRAMASKAERYGWPVLPLDSGHCPMASCPRRLASLLGATARMESPEPAGLAA